jgi:DNA-binding protein H-NS
MQQQQPQRRQRQQCQQEQQQEYTHVKQAANIGALTLTAAVPSHKHFDMVKPKPLTVLS